MISRLVKWNGKLTTRSDSRFPLFYPDEKMIINLLLFFLLIETGRNNLINFNLINKYILLILVMINYYI